MRLLLIDIVTTLLCLVSMLLTGLFALNFTHHDGISGTFYLESENYSTVVLLLIVGIAIDLSKYLFWQYRAVKKAYILVSVSLVFFSWAASVAYFITVESTQIETVRQTTTPYYVYEAEKTAIQTAIINKEMLLGQRLASRYHEQWDKSESLLKDIEALNTDLRQLIEQAATVGLDTAQTQVSTSAFFLQLSTVLQVSHTLVTTVAYGLLALLIEVCALGTLSLSQHLHQPLLETAPADKGEKKSAQPLKQTRKRKIRGEKLSIDQRQQRLRSDILQGNVLPAFAEIKQAKYNLSQTLIKAVLTELHQGGYLEKDRRGFRLLDNDRPPVDAVRLIATV